MSNIKFFTFYTPNTQKNLRINVLNSIGMVRYKCYFLFIHVLFFLSLIQQNISSFSLSTTHYFLPHSLSLRLLISSSNFCEPTLIFISTIFITQILASLIFISISLTEFFFFNLHLPHRFFFFFLTLSSLFSSQNWSNDSLALGLSVVWIISKQRGLKFRFGFCILVSPICSRYHRFSWFLQFCLLLHTGKFSVFFDDSLSISVYTFSLSIFLVHMCCVVSFFFQIFFITE